MCIDDRSRPPQPLQLTVVAPHPDDAALSLGGTLDRLARAGATITLVTCHTRSRWAPAARRLRGDVEAVTRQRAGEDEAYARLLGARLVRLGLDEAMLRLPRRAVERAPARADREHARRLVPALRPHLRSSLTLLPLGIGDHVDHAVVRIAGVTAARRRPLGFYEDVPYVLWSGWSRVATKVRAVERALERRLYPLRVTGGARRARQQAIACYPSQFSSGERRWIERAMDERGGEILWTTRRMHAALQRWGTLAGARLQ